MASIASSSALSSPNCLIITAENLLKLVNQKGGMTVARTVACRAVAAILSLFQARIWFRMASDQTVARSLSPLWTFESVISIFCCSCWNIDYERLYSPYLCFILFFIIVCTLRLAMETLSKLCYLLRNYATINTDSSLHVPYAFTLNLSCPRRTVFRTFLDSIQQITIPFFKFFQSLNSALLYPLQVCNRLLELPLAGLRYVQRCFPRSELSGMVIALIRSARLCHRHMEWRWTFWWVLPRGGLVTKNWHYWWVGVRLTSWVAAGSRLHRPTMVFNPSM